MGNLDIVYPKPKHDSDGKFTEITLKRVEWMDIVGSRFFARQERRYVPEIPKVSPNKTNKRGKWLTV